MIGLTRNDAGGCDGVEDWSDAAKVSDVEEAGLGEGGYLVVIAQVGVEDEAEVAGGGGGVYVGSWGERE